MAIIYIYCFSIHFESAVSINWASFTASVKSALSRTAVLKTFCPKTISCTGGTVLLHLSAYNDSANRSTKYPYLDKCVSVYTDNFYLRIPHDVFVKVKGKAGRKEKVEKLAPLADNTALVKKITDQAYVNAMPKNVQFGLIFMRATDFVQELAEDSAGLLTLLSGENFTG